MNEIHKQRLTAVGLPTWPLTDEMKSLATHAHAEQVARILLHNFDDGFWREGTLIPSWTQINARRPLIDRMVMLDIIRKRSNKALTGHYYSPTPYTRSWSLYAIHIPKDTNVSDAQ